MIDAEHYPMNIMSNTKKLTACLAPSMTANMASGCIWHNCRCRLGRPGIRWHTTTGWELWAPEATADMRMCV
uniref:Uncharacterized protein n=1 Tax=Romanomermis culicivorax TaxID=13658 RepID=A0A915JKF1_ROMCU